MPEQLDWVYYDSVSSGTSASTELTFFNQTEGGTNIQTTNMSKAGGLPGNETFEVHEVIAYLESDTEHADLVKIMDKAVLKLQIGDDIVLQAPMICFAPNAYLHSTTPTLDQGALTSISSTTGEGFKLNIPITIPKGASFKVVIKIGEGSTPTASDIKVALKGILARD